MKRAGFLLLALSVAALIWVLLQSDEQPAAPQLPSPPITQRVDPVPSQLGESGTDTQRAQVKKAWVQNPVKGIVRGPDGQPVAAVRVDLLQREAPFPTREEKLLASILTAADGRFVFEEERRAGQLVEVSGRGIARMRAEVSVPDPELEVQTMPGFRLLGIVETPDGSPLRDCDVYVEPNIWASSPAIGTRTDERGAFEFTALEPDVVRVTARHPDFQPATMANVTIGAIEILRIRLAERGLELRGHLHAAGAGAQPIAGARVRLFPPSWNGALFAPFSTTTAADGSFTVRGLGPNNLRVEVQHQDYSTTSTVVVPRPEPVDLRLEMVPRSKVTGRLASLVEIAGATLQLSTAGGEVGIAEIAPDGSFAFPGRYSAGIARLELTGGSSALGVSGERSLTLRIEEDGATDLTLDLHPAPRVVGQVLCRDGAPLAGVKVREAKRLGGGSQSQEGVLAVSDREGRFAITQLPSGRVQLRLVHPAHAIHDIDLVVPGQGEIIELPPVQLQSPAELRGRVVRGSQPLPGAVVFANRGQLIVDYAVTDARGEFLLRQLGPGSYRLRTRFSTARVETLDKPVVVEPGRPVEPVEIRYEAGRVVRGVVVDRAGRPVPDTLLLVLNEAGASVRSGPDGRFSLEVPERETWLKAIKFDPEVVVRERVPRDVGELRIEMPLGPRARVVSAKVLALPGKVPVTNAIVRFEPLDLPPGTDVATIRQRTILGRFVELATGELRLLELPAGRSRLSIEAGGLVPHRIDVELEPDSDQDLGTIVLEQGARFRGRVVGPDGRAIAGAAIHVGRVTDYALSGFTPGQRSDSEGRFTVSGIGPHSRRILAAASGHAIGMRELEIPADLLGADPAPIVLQRGASLRVQVRGPAQRGVALATVLLRRQGTILAVGYTADDGTTEFDHLAPGTYELLLPQHRERMQEITITEGQAQADVAVQLGPERKER